VARGLQVVLFRPRVVRISVLRFMNPAPPKTR
jgi:hypothetical protein